MYSPTLSLIARLHSIKAEENFHKLQFMACIVNSLNPANYVGLIRFQHIPNRFPRGGNVCFCPVYVIFHIPLQIYVPADLHNHLHVLQKGKSISFYSKAHSGGIFTSLRV